MTSKKITSNPNTARKRWLGSGSVIAAATALVSVSNASEAHAQQSMSGPRVLNSAPNVLAARRMAQRLAPREVAGETVSVPRVQQNQPDNLAILPNARVNMVAPTQQQQIAVAPAPAVPAPAAPAANGLSVPIPQAQGTQQTGFSVQPLAASVSGVPGINVSAEAAFDDTRIDFIAGIAVDTVDVLASSAIIDWTTFDAGAAGTEVSFLTPGRNLAFVSSNQSDYTVLNRVFTPGFDSAIRIDGNVTSTVQGGITGGNIWFYSPGGIVIGSNAAFNIGSLLLTTSAPDPLDVTTGNFDVSFLGTPDANSFIRIEDGASITANNNNSYIAMVAPRIEQNGEVRANGSIAYVAAEQATLTIDNGLFDISVDVGSGHSSGDGIVHGETGITAGPAQDNQLDEQGIYFVAVPKNNAINMLVGGTVGFEAATSATEVDGKIILTTGDDVSVNRRSVLVNGSFENQYFNTISQEVGGVGAGDITLDNITLNSSTEVFAEGNLTVANLAGGSPSDPVDLELSAGNTLTLDVTDGNSLRVAGDLNLRAGSSANQGGTVVINVSDDNAAGGGGGGPVVIDPSGPAGLGVDGNMTIDTGARGADDFFTIRNNGGTGIGQDAAAGDVSINIGNGGNFEVGNDLDINASAQGGKGEQQNGSADAGSFALNLADGGFSVGGLFSVNTSANDATDGKVGGNGPGRVGADSVAGDVTINFAGGGTDIGGLVVDAIADSSPGTDEATVQSNDAIAANFTLNVSGGFHSIGSISVDLESRAGESSDGTPDTFLGNATRGTAIIAVTGLDTGLEIGDDLSIFADVFGAVALPVGDTVSVTATDTGTTTGAGLTIGENLIIQSRMTGGEQGVVGKGGTINVAASNGQIFADGVIISSPSIGGTGVTGDLVGSDFTGGDITLSATNNGVINVDGGGTITVDAIGTPQSDSPDVGIGLGGTISVLANDGTISFGDTLNLRASGFADAGFSFSPEPGLGQGGTIRLTVDGNTGSLAFANLSARTDGSEQVDIEASFGSAPTVGSAGTGGTTEINVLAGTITAADVTLSAGGFGGRGGVAGAGNGGDVTFNLEGGTATINNLSVEANGSGGSGGGGSDFSGTAGGIGGASAGGNATFNGASGSLTITDVLSVEATGDGGRGGNGVGVAAGGGGASEGGTATFNLNGTAVIDAAQLVVSTQAFGGNGGASEASFSGDPDQGGGAGGNAAGGDAVFNDIAGNLSFGTLTVNSSGEGGQGGSSFGFGSGDADGTGGDGGDGTGGTALISLNQNDNSPKNYSALSQGIGGDGGSGNGGGNGGTGIGGSAEVAVNDVSVLFNQAVLDTTATGGTAGFNDTGNVVNGADGGDAQGGLSSLSVSGPNGNFTANALVDISAGATGGVGEFGNSSFDPVTAAGQGGAGGNAAGGTAQILISDGASVFIDADSAVLHADTVGGQGGDGGEHFSGGDGGDGGTGGSATGGTVGIVATNGADVSVSSLSVPFALSSTGRGGDGGRGGDAISGTLGFGGDGGNGTGGSPTLSATGATIAIADVALFAEGFGGDAGDGGADGSGSEAPGNNGIGIGGAPLIEVIEGSPGIITLGDVTITATGSGGTAGNGIAIGDGGQVTIRDMSPDPAGLITFGDLTVTATGDPASTTGNLTFESASGPITVNGNLNADLAGDIDFDLDGTGQVVVSGATTLVATNDITFTHSGNAAENLSIDTGARFTATAGGDFIAGEGTIIDAAQVVTIVAENIDYHDITSVQTVNLTATNGSITGTAAGTIIATAVTDAINLLATQDVTFGILNNVDGDPDTRDGNIDIDAGGDIVGVSAISGQFINLDATGLVMVGTVDTSVTNVGTVTINAGSIDLGALDARFISNLTSATGDIGIDTISGLTSVGLDSAANIIIGTADTSGFSADALAGDITIGSLTTTGVADVRLNAGGDISYTSIDGDRLISLDSNTITGGDLVAEAQIDLTAGSIDIGNTRSIGGNVLITSTAGDIAAGAIVSDVFGAVVDSAAAVDLGDITTGSTARVVSAGDAIVGDIDADGSTVINAGGNITAGDLFSGTNSPGMTITALGDANIASATANGGLTFNVDGALTGGDFTGQGALSIVTLNAGSVDVASVESTNQMVIVDATDGDAIVGSATSAGSTRITGENVTLNSGTIGTTLRLIATNGSISGMGSISVAGGLNLDATQNVTFGSLSAGNAFTVNALGGDINFDEANSSFAAIRMVASGDINGGSLTTQDSFLLDNIDLSAGGTLTINSATSADAVLLTGNVVDAGIITGTSSAIVATTLADIGNLTSTGNANVSAETVNLNSGNIGGNLTATSTLGDITGSGAIAVDGSANFNSAANIAIGSLDADSITLLAASDIQFDNLNSPNTVEIQTNSGLIGATTPGEGNITSGGDVDLQSMTMALGDITAAGAINAEINGNASFGDLDAGTDILILAVGTPTIAGVTSGGDTGIQGASVELNGGDVGGDLGVVAAAGDLILALDGDDQIQVDGTTTLGAVGEIQIGHTNNANGTVSLNSVGAIGMLATGDITSTEGAIIASQGIVGIRTESDLSIADVRGVGLIDLSAAGNTTVNDATLAGGTSPVGAGSIVTGGIVITAGGDNGTGIEFFDPTALALITGNVISDGLILVEAGGDAVFQGGSSTVSDNGLVVVTGDDIIVQTGALVEAAADPVAIANTAAPFAADAGNLLLSAGELGGQLFTTPLSPISSIVISGTVEANDFAAVLTANAIDGLGGTVSASSFAADIINAPNDGIAQSDDDGLLSANCLEGNICLGTINANNQILIGQDSNNDAIGLIVEQGTVNANTILITTRNDIVMGTNGIATVLNAVDTFSATSINGDVNLVDAAISSDQVLIEAAGSLIGTSSLTSVNDIGITVGDSVQVAAIVTDGELTNVADVGGALEGQYSVAGDFDAGLLSLGAADIAMNAGGNINIGEAIAPDNITLTADGDAFLGAADITGDIDIFAQNIGFGNLAADGSIILETNVGDIVADAGGTLDAGADIDLIAAGNADAAALNAGASVGIDAGGNVSFTGIDAGIDATIGAVGTVTGQDIVAGNDVDVQGDLINLGDVTAVGTASINGASIAVSDVMADQIDLLSGADILFDSLISPNAIAVTAANGTIGANTGTGDIESGAGVTLGAQTIDVGDITANGNVAASATMGALSVGAVTNNALGSAISLNAGGPAGTIAAGSLTTNNGDILLSTGGDIALGSAATSAGTPTAGSIGILSGGDVTITGTLAAGEDAGIRSLGNIDAAAITAADDITVLADGAITIGSAANTGVGIDQFRLVFDDTNAGGAGSILFAGETFTGSNIILDGGTDVTVTGTVNAVDTVTLTGGGISAAEVIAGGDVTAISTAGQLIIDNTISGGTITLTGQGNILIDHAEADGDLIATGQAGLTTGLNSIITGGDIVINMPFGIADLGNSTAGGLVDVTAEQIDFVTLSAGGTVDLLTIDQTGGSVTTGNGNITGTDLTAGPGPSSIVATFGNINIGGTALIGGSLDADASGDLFINLLTTEGGGYTGTAGGQIGFNGITSADFVDLDADSILGNGPINAAGDVIALGTTSVTVNGAITSGGVVSLISLDGPVDVQDVDADDDVTVNGFGITTGDVTSGGNVDADANTGNATMGTIDATGSIDVVADGVATIAALNSGTNSTVTAAAVDVTGGGTVGGDLTLNATASDLAASGPFAVGGAIDLDAAGDIAFGILDAAGGAFTADAGGAIDFTEASASGAINFNAQTSIIGGNISSDTAISLDAVTGPITVADLTADGPIDATTGAAFTANDITQTDGTLTIDADGGASFVNASGASVAAIITGADAGVTGASLSTTGSVDISTGTVGADIGTLTTDTANVTATGGPVAIDDAILTGSLTADGSSVNIQSSTDLMVDANANAGDVQVIAQGNLDAIGTAIGDVALISLGNNAVINGASGQNVSLSAGGALDVIGAVDAAQALDVSAGGLMTLDALAIGETINVDAGDVDITTDGRLGDATVTQSVTFTGFEEMLLGGAGGSGAPYEIDNDEFSRIHSGGDVIFQVFAQNTGDPALITVDTLDVGAGDGTGSFDQNIGQAAGLVLLSDQDIAVVGDLNIFNATLDTLVIAEAVELIRVNSETGGIFVLDANDALAGVIEITARDFNAVTDSAFTDIQGLSVADIDARLANSGGVDRPDGILRADTLDIDTTASQVFIQNTVAGTDFAERRGFDVNTLLISDSGGTVQPIVINGLIGGIAGIDTIPLATISSTFDIASTINGCLIGNVASCSPIIITPINPANPVAPNDDSRDLIEEGLDPEENPGTGAIDAGLLQYLPDAEFGAEPLIDEPVTGAGNEDLWVDPECPPGADPEICAAEPAE